MFWKQEPKNNPFNFREPVYEQDSFFGREQEVRSLIDFMRVGQSVAIQGPAKIGKTSLLKYVSSSVVLAENGFDPANFVGVYINCTDLENKDLTQCFRYLGQQINQRVKQVTSKSITYGNSFTGLRRGIQEHEDQGLRTILILDNFDALSCNPYITHTFLLNLRALDQEHASSLSYLVASEGNLAELERTQFTGNGTNGSPFANVFALLPLGSLSPEGSQELLEKQLAKVEPPLLQPDPETLQKITEAYKAQEPYRLQWLGWQLVAAWHNRLEMDEDIYGKPLAQSLRQLPYLNLDGIEQADASLPLANRLLRFYPLLVIIIGVAAAIYLAGRLLGPTGQWTVYTLGSAAAALGLFILSDSRPLVFQDTQISLGFLVILIFLLLPEKYVNRPDVHTWLAALIPVIGALLSEPLHQRQQPVIPSPYAIQRVFFYAAQHAVVALLSSLIYLQATHWEWGQTILNNIRLPALPVNVLVYAIAYAILSPIIMAPYDYTIRHLLRPANETFLPRLNLWILLLLAPMPITLAFFFTGGQSWVFVVLALLLLFFIMLAGTYPNIEGNRNRLQTLSETTQALGTPHSMNALGKQLQHMLDARVDYAWGAIYATRADESEGSGKRHYFLRATLEKTEAGSSLSNYEIGRAHV